MNAPAARGPESCPELVDKIAADEAGAPAAPAIERHVTGCAHCQSALARIGEVRTSLGAIALPAAAPRWESTVMARINREVEARAKRSWRRFMTIVPVGVALAGAAALGLFLRPGAAPQGSAPIVLAFHYERPAHRPVTRGDVAVGDLMVLSASGVTGKVAELRIYQDDHGLRLRCAGEPPCTRTGETLAVKWPIPAPGRYRAIVVSATAPLPASTGSFDGDVGALGAQPGVTLETFEKLEVW